MKRKERNLEWNCAGGGERQLQNASGKRPLCSAPNLTVAKYMMVVFFYNILKTRIMPALPILWRVSGGKVFENKHIQIKTHT